VQATSNGDLRKKQKQKTIFLFVKEREKKDGLSF
jgi:hypothetical protein